MLGQRGYRTLIPPNNLKADAPTQRLPHEDLLRPGAARLEGRRGGSAEPDAARRGGEAAAHAGLLALDPGSMLVVVLGTAFHASSTPVAGHVPKHQPAYVRFDASQGAALLPPHVKKVTFTLLIPTVLERSSYPDTLLRRQAGAPLLHRRQAQGRPPRLQDGRQRVLGDPGDRLGRRARARDRSFRHDLGGREFDLYYSGSHLHMVVLQRARRDLLGRQHLARRLSNETMLAIAKGLKPLTTGK